jgi:hypothetical protein
MGASLTGRVRPQEAFDGPWHFVVGRDGAPLGLAANMLRNRTIRCFDGIGEDHFVEVASRQPTLAVLAALAKWVIII